MRFNLLLYVPALADNLNMEYGVFIQHHLMDDADIELDYFDFSKINPENYALDIVDKKEVTKKLRKDCLVDGFTLNSYYTLDLDNSYNRNINKDEVRQIFVCFKNNSKESLDAFIRLAEDQRIEDYQVSNNLIFFRLWTSSEMDSASDIPLNIGKINYSDFEYFRGIVKQEVNNQWHSVLNKKRTSSKAALAANSKEVDTQLEINEDPPIIIPKLENIFVEEAVIPSEVLDNRLAEYQEVLTPQNNVAVTNNKQGSEAFKFIAYALLALGVISIIGKLFGGS